MKRVLGRVVAPSQAGSTATSRVQLIEHDVVDEYRLLIEPILLGGGTPIFPCDGRAPALELISTRTAGTGVLICTYWSAGH